MRCPFLDRSLELEALERAFQERPSFVVVYGRRRIGKTMLLREWISRNRNKVKPIYYLAQLTSHEHNLSLMAEAAYKQLGEDALMGLRARRLTDILNMLSRLGANVIVIDEFTYWVRSYEGVLSELQEYVDLYMDRYDVLLVISGSLVGLMEERVLGGGSPLYARAASRLRLDPLPFKYLKTLLPGWDPVDRVRLYSIIGGIPFYYCLVQGAGSLREAVRRLLLSIDSPLLAEKDLLLREHFRELHAYNAVLSALARGYNTPGKIAGVAGIEVGYANKILHTLEALGFIERMRPLHARRGFYRVKDPILRTWYSLVEPILSLLEIGLHREAEERVLEMLDSHTASAWEQLVGEYLYRLYAPRGYRLVGPAIRHGEEIDVVLLDEAGERAIVAEAKWSDVASMEVERIRRRVLRKAGLVLPRGVEVERVYIAVRSVRGASPGDVITPWQVEEEPV